MAMRAGIASLFFLLFALLIPSLLATGTLRHDLRWASSELGCSGLIGECTIASDEFELDSETNRRFLATSDYISYDALRRDSVPCSRRGASYYNCRPGAEANPYSRGCSAITQCRS